MSSTDLIAVFSYSPGGGGPMIAITTDAAGWDMITMDRPAVDARPLTALRAMGYQPADPAQARYVLKSTMADTGYAKIRVRPITP